MRLGHGPSFQSSWQRKNLSALRPNEGELLASGRKRSQPRARLSQLIQGSLRFPNADARRAVMKLPQELAGENRLCSHILDDGVLQIPDIYFSRSMLEWPSFFMMVASR